MCTAENVWLQQHMDTFLVCLPLERIELDCNLCHVTTKAAVIRNELEQRRYSLGKTNASLIKRVKSENESLPYIINALTKA
ncbi:hypothetical protein CEXT_812411 [Caerostris extrusa]|uniref:Uncharacterized protein n=1 Tax=Caerostris extrusa TaxID=172846 RepID=A0AAV4PZT5_CAEEX|nr:hypothetical protein CEXT_812411 [Caerostris extrusa]